MSPASSTTACLMEISMSLFSPVKVDFCRRRGWSENIFLCLFFPDLSKSNSVPRFKSEHMKEIVNCAAYSGGRRTADVQLANVHEVLRHADQFVWIGLHEPSEEVLSRVQEEFGLHDLAVEDAHVAHQRPKVELY